VTDSDLGHDGDGDSLHDLPDHTGVGLFVSGPLDPRITPHTIRATPPSRLMLAGIRSDNQLIPKQLQLY
jgi:hypothetical protein